MFGTTHVENRSKGRGLGPFTSGHLTIIVVTLIVVVMFPVGAWAVTGSNVFVTDSGTGAHAFVSNAGQLNVTRAGAKSYVRGAATLTSTSPLRLLKPTAGKALVITTLGYNVSDPFGNPVQSKSIIFEVSVDDATCNGAKGVWYATPATVGPLNTSFDPGIVVPANRALCAVNLAGGQNLHVIATAFGYSIPAAAAPVETP